MSDTLPNDTNDPTVRIAELERRIEVEEALERVRVRAMAMHQSDELREVVKVLMEQIQPLGFESWGCSIIICDEGGMQNWVSLDIQAILPESYYVPALEHPVIEKQRTIWREQIPFQTFEMAGELKRTYDELLFEQSDFKRLSEAIKSEIRALEDLFLNYASLRHGLLEVVSLEPLLADKAAILQRFAQVFEQTYTRFLDLKRAEAQAQEAQVEAALERVRSRSMAMHHSEELLEVVEVLYNQLDSLSITTENFDLEICIIEEETGLANVWGRYQLADREFAGNIPGLVLPFTAHRIWNDEYNTWRQTAFEDRKELLILNEIRGEDWQNVLNILSTLPGWEDIAKHFEETPIECWYTHNAYFAYGCFTLQGMEAIDKESQAILQRFARVFEQVYTRFLDLKTAEEQAKEAQIEAALERVRARAMAMRQSDELEEVVTRVFDAFEDLDIDPGLINLGFVDHPHNTWRIWNAMRTHEEYSVFEVIIPTFDHPLINNVTAAYERGDSMLVFKHAGEDKRRYDAHLFEHVDFPEAVKETILSIDSLMGNFIFTKQGFLTAWRSQSLEAEEVTLLQRFANVIDLTYTRFDDLQQAEARAREATRQASLDRIRAEIASMRLAKDLERITPLIWRELTTLDVPFFRCGVFIVDEASHTTHTYLSTPDGTSLAVLHLPFEGISLIEEIIGYWRKRTRYTTEWDAQQFAAFGADLVEKRYLDTTEAYQGGKEPPEHLVLQFLPFTQGMLYVGSAAPLVDDQIELVQTLADTFSVAYARYEDFTKLEAAKAQIEATLADLQATQSQLIQQEKMASLGQLTAGIAHEIKNPLNFVNNFSSLISDLVSELRSSPDARVGDELELIDILAMNAQKINEHGHRANRIVESMMQHASGAQGERRVIPVNTFVEEYVNLAVHGVKARHEDFEVEIDRHYDQQAGELELVPQDIGQVLVNLFNNAFDAMLEKKERMDGIYTAQLHVSTQRKEGTVLIRVSDNAAGIPPEVQEKIFEPFFTTKPTGSGTGLGLSLSYDIVTQGHRGSLEVESEAGQGATFTIRLPA